MKRKVKKREKRERKRKREKERREKKKEERKGGKEKHLVRILFIVTFDPESVMWSSF